MSDRPSVFVSSGIGLILSCVLWHAYAKHDGYRCETTTTATTTTTECRLTPDKEDEND